MFAHLITLKVSEMQFELFPLIKEEEADEEVDDELLDNKDEPKFWAVFAGTEFLG